MKLHQFAQLSVESDQQIQELIVLGFLDHLQEGPKELWYGMLAQAFPEQTSTSDLNEALANLLATPTQNLRDFFLSDLPITQEVFYLVSLQLLQFQVGIDCDATDSLTSCRELGITVEEVDMMTEAGICRAWYTLLTTHTKNGLSYIDWLASRGFYASRSLEKPFFFNGKAQAVFDTDQLIREVVYVETDLDTDETGKRDLVKVEVLRPAETEDGLRVPVLFTASPYNQGVNPEAGEKMTHDVNVPLTRKEPTIHSYEDIRYKAEAVKPPVSREINEQTKQASETFIREKSYTMNDYFLARGFGVVYSAGIGTRDSDGIQTCGSVEQTMATVAVIEWLAGNRRAFTNRTDQIAIEAWWSNGKTAMTGKSYLGTLATAAATTGVEGLETIVSEAAISNWYQYYRDNGLVIAPGGYPGEDADVLAEETFSRMHDAGDYLQIASFFRKKQQEMTTLQDRETGNYNTFWDERNYLPNVKNIKADIVMVHGLNDWNVKPRHVKELWEALKETQGVHKLILHQGQHIYIHNHPSIDFLDMMNLWFTHKLYGIENGAKAALPPIIYQENTQAESWRTATDWEGTEAWTLSLGQDRLAEKATQGTVTFSDQLPAETYQQYTKQVEMWESEIKAENSPLADHRYLALTEPLKKDVQLRGEPLLTIQASSSVDFGMLSVQLIDYGKEKRLKEQPDTLELKGLPLGYHWREEDVKEFKLGKETPYKLITRGHINMQNREYPWQVDDLQADQLVTLQFRLQPTIYRLLAGHRLGILIVGTDYSMTVRGNQDIRYTIALEDSHLQLPIEKIATTEL